MKLASQDAFSTNGLCKLKNQDWLNKQRIAGKIAADTLVNLQRQVEGKTTRSLLELNEIAEQQIINAGGIPTFKGYKGFPAGVCISVNKQLVHGIPVDYKLQDGDVVSFDLGVTIEGAIADTAITCIYGTPKSEIHATLVKATEESLMKGIAAIQVGNRLGCIGHAISKCARGYGFSVITKYGGHGLDWNVPHASPFVENKAELDQGIRIQPGLTIAIEPMLVVGSTDTRTLEDGWTVVTNDIGAHFEHSVFVHPDHVEIITQRDYAS
jgi:methionyl aminopeptidase